MREFIQRTQQSKSVFDYLLQTLLFKLNLQRNAPVTTNNLHLSETGFIKLHMIVDRKKGQNPFKHHSEVLFLYETNVALYGLHPLIQRIDSTTPNPANPFKHSKAITCHQLYNMVPCIHCQVGVIDE